MKEFTIEVLPDIKGPELPVPDVEIVRELLHEHCEVPLNDQATVDLIWSHCAGNPWNAVPMYRVLQFRDRVV